LVIIGFWPAIKVMSSTAWFKIFLSPKASPTPIFKVIFSMRGTAITLEQPISFCKAGRISLTYFSL
jgi:hypothetical protein